MADVLTTEQRKYCMSRIRGKDTKPEMIVRRLVHSLGYRYRLHVRALPGSPDIVLGGHRKVIFVHGCFWHMHRCKYGRVVPKTNRKFWERKRSGTVERCRKNVKALKKLGWEVLIVWECWTRDVEKTKGRIQKFLGEKQT